MSTLSSVIQRGTRVIQPGAATVPVGTLYFVTDEFVLERSSGSAWQSESAVVFVGDSGAGGARGIVPAPAIGDAAKFLRGDAVWAATSAGALTLIQQIITAASQATVDFTGIPATYKTLIVDFIARDTIAGTSSTLMRVRVNNDNTSGNYTVSAFTGIQNGATLNSTNAASASGVFVMGLPHNGNTAGITNAGRLIIPGYAQTTFHKRINTQGSYEDGTTNLTTITLSARWKSTVAIDRLTFLTDGTAFLNGSIFNLYGLN